MEEEISLKLRELARIRRRIKKNEIFAFRQSLEDPQDVDSNPFQDEVEFLKLQEIHLLQEIQYLKRSLTKFNTPSFSFSAFRR